MKRVPKKNKVNLKFHDVTIQNEKIRTFEENIIDFKKTFFENGKIIITPNFIKVHNDNIIDWNKTLHEKFCLTFGVKLTRIERKEIWTPEKNESYQLHVDYIYVDEQDSNFKELRWDMVRL